MYVKTCCSDSLVLCYYVLDSDSVASEDLKELFQDLEQTGNEITYNLLKENIRQGRDTSYKYIFIIVCLIDV